MNTDTIPNTIDGRIAFLQNASTLITATPADYGLVAGDATAFHALVTALVAARAGSTTAQTAAQSATVALQQADDDAETAFRAMAQGMRVDITVTDENLATIGVFRRNPPAPIVPPTDAPVLTLEGLNVGSANISLRQVGGSRSRPLGCVGAELSLVNGATAPVEGEADTGTKRFTSKASTVVATDIGATRVRLYARWMTPRGAYSPWSLAVAFSPQS